MEKEDGSDGVKTKRKRGPRRCRRCPGNPLQTECPEHGAKHARMRRLRKQQMVMSTCSPAQHTPVDPPSQVPSQELVPETRQQNEQAPAPNEPDRTSPPPNTHSSAPHDDE
ncbi:hypothetical protein MPER_11897 [Moniliophthora perniciosa FA553]|nr:hypothetical protein MPER_11897 [Moniliophthora perniciosa FA553]